MSTKIEFQNNYDKFKEDFRKDTGNEWSPGSVAYTAYFHARIADMHYQLTLQLANRFLNDISTLPDRTGVRLGESIKEILRNQQK